MKNKLTKKDQATKVQSYIKKVDEYSKMSLEELKDLYPKLGGTYRMACLHVTDKKLKELAENNLKETIKDIKENDKNDE